MLLVEPTTAAARGEADREQDGEEEPDGYLDVRRRTAHRGECTISRRAKRSHLLQAVAIDPRIGRSASGGRLNVPLYRMTRGRVGGRIGRAPVLLLTTTGRKSGQARTAPVLYMRDADRLVVIGSNAGNVKTPAWALNLVANPEATVEVGARRHDVRARTAEGEERVDLWRRMNEQYAGFDDYRGRHDPGDPRVRARASVASTASSGCSR